MYAIRSFGGIPGLQSRPGVALAMPMASAQSFNSRPVYKKMGSMPPAPVPVQVRKSFPESWIFDNLDETR